MRAVALGRDAIVVTSSLWQTNALALRSGEEAVLIDSPYFPDELDMLPALLEQSGFTPSGLLATHADYDHMLGRLAFPGMALGVGEMTGEGLRRHPGAVQRALRAHGPRSGALGATRPPGATGRGRHRCRSARSRSCRCRARSSWARRSSGRTPPRAILATAWRTSRASPACSPWATTSRTSRSR